MEISGLILSAVVSIFFLIWVYNFIINTGEAAKSAITVINPNASDKDKKDAKWHLELIREESVVYSLFRFFAILILGCLILGGLGTIILKVSQ